MKRRRPAPGQLSLFETGESTETTVSTQSATPEPDLITDGEGPADTPQPPTPPQPLAIATPPEPEILFPQPPSVTFHKNGKKLLVKPNDVLAADIWREVTDRLKNPLMRSAGFFNITSASAGVQTDKLHMLWQWVIPGLDSHPWKEVLESYGVSVHVAPSLDGYLQNERRHILLESAPYPCYESSNDDLSECVQIGMILRAKATLNGFESDKRYWVVDVRDGAARISTEPLRGRTVIQQDGPSTTIRVSELNDIFEDSDRFVLKATMRDLFPDRVSRQHQRLGALPIDEKLYEHVREDVVCESLKRGFLCSKEMRMGKTSEAIAACELKGSSKVAWIAPASATIDLLSEFEKRGVSNFAEISSLQDLANPARYHIFIFDFLKATRDPLERQRHGQKSRTWLRAMGEGTNEAPCPHCGCLLERPICIKDARERVVEVTWTTTNGYACRNASCRWTDTAPRRRRNRKCTGAGWHSGKTVIHEGGYLDFERKQHADCGDHVGRRRMCPRCGAADSTWVPPIYKRIKKNYPAIVVDESNKCKEESSKTSKAALAFRGKHHIGLTGTPMSKDLLDLYEQLLWICKGPTVLFPFSRADSKSAFKQRFCEEVTVQRNGDDKRKHSKTLPYAKNPVELWNFLAPLIVRRTRRDPLYQESLRKLNLHLPSEKSFVTPVAMVPEQAQLLLRSIEEFQAQFEEYCKELEEKGHSLNPSLVIGQMSRMKIAATVPAMLNQEGMPPLYVGEPMGGKGVCLGNLVPAKLMEGKKIVLLSDFVLMRKLLAERFSYLNPILVESGTVKQKRATLARFRDADSRGPLIAGPRQICYGTELNCADVLVVCDLMYLAADQQQALARLMGPTSHERTVEQYILVTQPSIDEHIYNLFYSRVAGMEQALDKRVVTRTAEDINWKAFADRVIEQQEAVARYMRENGANTFVMPDFSEDLELERIV